MVIVRWSISDGGSGGRAFVLGLVETRLINEVGVDWHRWGGQRSLGMKAATKRLKIGSKLITDFMAFKLKRV